MENIRKKIIIALLIIAALVGIGYGAYHLYHIAIEHAIGKIKKGVSEGVSKGIRRGINPFRKILG